MGKTMAAQITFKAIGHFHSDQVEPYEASRQPDENHSEGYINLESGHNFEQALTGLTVGSRIWILFMFHHNPHWNPMVLPPRGGNQKVGVFATRSPYRPNPIGMSCVQILKIEKLKIYVSNSDILDGSPILDIKPYISYADAHLGEEPTWLKSAQKYEVRFTTEALEQLNFLEQHGVTQLRGFLLHQLEYEPDNSKKKRVKSIDDRFLISYRTWRTEFLIEQNSIIVLKVYSGYSTEELITTENPYGDKEIHRAFMQHLKPKPSSN